MAQPPIAYRGDMDGLGSHHMIAFRINGVRTHADTAPDKPLLWVLREDLQMTGTKFGCGGGFCGACTVHVDGDPVRACQISVGEVEDKSVTTIEGLSPRSNHPLQTAWIAQQVPQCGYCQSGQIMQAAALLKANPRPSRRQIIAHMKGNLCRCGTYNRIIAAIQRAARGG